MIVTTENDVRSLDRIMDQNHGDNSLAPKRAQFNSMGQGVQDGSKNAQRRLKSPKNSNINISNTKNQQQQNKKVTLKHLQINNPVHSMENVAAQMNFKQQASGTNSFQIQSTTNNRATHGNFAQVTTPVGQHNTSLIANLNQKAGSVGPSGLTLQVQNVHHTQRGSQQHNNHQAYDTR